MIRIITYIILPAVALLTSCKKNTVTDNDGNRLVKGAVRLEVSVKHHFWGVGNINLYLKQDTTASSDTTKFSRVINTDAAGNAVFENLFIGNYYMYATGYDATWGAPVYGGHPITLNSSTVTNNECYFTLYVSE